MVSDAFGVSLEPFGISPDPRFMYFDSKLDREHQVLLESLRQGVGLAVITGEHGVGKTMLLHYLAAELDVANHLVVYVSCLGSPSVDDIMGIFAVQIGLPGDFAVEGENSNKISLAGMLGSAGVCATTAILFLDDADRLSAETLSALSTMTRGDTKKGAAISIVLAGSPDLAPRLDASRDRFPRRRRDINVSLTPLTPQDAESYILHRLRVAGGGENMVFTPDAIARVAHHARGNPQAINRMCRAAMIVSVGQSHNNVSVDVVDQVAPSSVAAGQNARASDSPYARSSSELAAALDTRHSTDESVQLPEKGSAPHLEPAGSAVAPVQPGEAAARQNGESTGAKNNDWTLDVAAGAQQSSDTALPSGRNVAAAMAADAIDRPQKRVSRGPRRMMSAAVGALTAVAVVIVYILVSSQLNDRNVGTTDVPASADVGYTAENGPPEESTVAPATAREVSPPSGDEPSVFAEQTTMTPSPLWGSPLEKAVFLGDIGAVEALLDARANSAAPVAGGGTLLVVAANNGDEAMVRYLIERGADPSFGTVDVMDLATDTLFPESNGQSGTMAGEPGSPDAVTGFSPASGTREPVIGKGLDANSREMLSRDLLGAATGTGDPGNSGAAPGSDPETSSNLGVTPLIAAARRGHADVVNVLIGAGANVNVADTRGQTALMAAIDAGDGESTRLLLLENPDIHAVDDMGRTALDIARQKGRPDLANVLASRTGTLPPETTATRLAPALPQAKSKPVKDVKPAQRIKAPKQPSHDDPQPASDGMEDRVRVTQAQTYLHQLGFDPGPVDGVKGSKTQSAIVAFQHSSGLQADGKITANLINSLAVAASSRQPKQVAASRQPKQVAAEPPAPVKPTEREDFIGDILSGFQNLRGLNFNSIDNPAQLTEYCAKNSDNWIYDNGTSRSVYCRDVLRQSKL